MSLGEIKLDALRRDRETEWYGLGYDLFSFDDGESYRRVLAAVRDEGAREAGDRLEVLAFVGLWCGDCQEHLPGFGRIWDTAGFERAGARLRVYSLDRAKSFPGGEELIARHGVTRLPTFVFLRGEREVGRITEAPEASLLADFARWVSAPA